MLRKIPLDKEGQRWQKMDYGPFMQYSYVTWPNTVFDNGPGSFTGDSTARGIALKLSEDWESGVIFDTDLMRVAAGWTGGPLKWRGLIFDGGHGWNPTLSNTPVPKTTRRPMHPARQLGRQEKAWRSTMPSLCAFHRPPCRKVSRTAHFFFNG